jgi:hypothetical protein
MQNQNDKLDVELYRQCQKSPIFFIDKIWKLIPQPIKPEYKDLVSTLISDKNFKEINKNHFEDFIKGKHITWQQWIILLMVENAIKGEGKKKISVVSGHGIGKDACLSWLIIWHLFCFKNSQIPTTAPTSELMHDVLWKEIKVWLDRMKPELSNLFDWTTGYIRVKESPETWFARARTARKEAPEAIAGVHGDYVMIAVDEASGVPEEIYKSAEGSLTGANVFVILIGNGTRNEGYFYDTHHAFAYMWQIASFDSNDSPIVEKDFISGIIDKYGVESDEYKIRVSGHFPSAEQVDEKGWIPLISEHQINQVSFDTEFTGRVKLGIDPSGEGDDMTIWKGRDNFIEKTIGKESTSTSKTIARKTVEIMEHFKLRNFDVVIDNFGEGANVSQEIMAIMPRDRTLPAYYTRGVNWADDATDSETYLNKRAECYFRLRNWLLKGGSVTDDITKRELVGIKYRNNLQGKKQIMDKPNMKKILGKSPDRSDALALTFYDEETIANESSYIEQAKEDKNFDRFGLFGEI